MKLAITVTGEDVAKAHLLEMALRAKDARPLSKAMREIVHEGWAKQYASRGSYFGSGWAPLSPETVRIKGNANVMVGTGRLRRAAGNPRLGYAARHSATATLGRAAWYAIFAQQGTKRGQPARPVVGLEPTERRRVNQAVVDWLVDGDISLSNR